MKTFTQDGYTAHYRTDFNVPNGWPPRLRIEQITRPDGSVILPDTFTGPGVNASFRSQLGNMKQVRSTVDKVIAWDQKTPEERIAYLNTDDIALF